MREFRDTKIELQKETERRENAVTEAMKVREHERKACLSGFTPGLTQTRLTGRGSSVSNVFAS